MDKELRDRIASIIRILLFVTVYWLAESLFCYSLSADSNFLQELFRPELKGLYRRIIVICFFVILDTRYNRIINEQKMELKQWMEYSNLLEQKTTKPAKHKNLTNP